MNLHKVMSCLVVLMACFALVACSNINQFFTPGYGEFTEARDLVTTGKYEEGLLRLEEVVKKYPRNLEYRIAWMNKRIWVINQYIGDAETAQNNGRLSDAEKYYQQALRLDPNHAAAKQGLAALITERRHRQLVTEAEAVYKKDGLAGKDAQDRLRAVLAENPNQKEALNLKARIDDAKARETRTETRLAATFRKPISIEFRDAPLKSVFDVISKVSGLNFFYDRDIRPDLKATVQAKNSSIEEVIRLLLVTNQLEQKVLNDNSILIYPNTPQKVKDYQPLTVRTFFLANADVKNVSSAIKAIVKTKDLVIDERLGLIIMRDTPEAIRLAEKLVAVQDLSDPEVMLEVEILEIKRNTLTELGIRWPDQLVLAPLKAADATSLTLTQLLNSRKSGSSISATVGNMTINARKEDADSDILANPRIRVRNKDKAKIMIGDRVPVITTTSTSTGFVSESVNYADVGLKLEVEPNIYLDDEVAIKVNLEVSSLVKEVTSKSGTLTYQIGTRGANTTLRLKDGETQILAGLISDEERNTACKVPGLGDMPILGRLFGSQKDDKQRSEVVLSITPRVLRSLRRPGLTETEFDSGTEANVGAPSLSLSTVESDNKTMPVGKASAPVAQTPAAATPAVIVPASGSAVPVKSASEASMPAVVNPIKPAAMAGNISLSWQLPAQIKVGEQFSAVLKINSQAALRGLPLLVGYDPQILQVVNVQEGDFLKQNNGQTQFSQRIDPVQGKVFIAAVRQNANGMDTGVNGMGSAVVVNFKAIKAGIPARIQLLSATPEPPANPLALPIEQSIKILP